MSESRTITLAWENGDDNNKLTLVVIIDPPEGGTVSVKVVES